MIVKIENDRMIEIIKKKENILIKNYSGALRFFINIYPTATNATPPTTETTTITKYKKLSSMFKSI